MSVFVIQSASGELLGKNLEWINSAVPSHLFQSPHKDVAVNQLIEVNAKDPALRARVIACEINDRGQPDITAAA